MTQNTLENPGGSATNAEPPRSPINVRSLSLGLAGVVGINALTPYNDFVLWNTFAVGNSLPLSAIILSFALVLVNALLAGRHRRHMLGAGELGVILAMLLVACAFPASGLMRYLPPLLVYPFHDAGTNAEFRRVLETMDLPTWLYPRFEGTGVREWANDPVVSGYVNRWIDPVLPPPYRAWIVPMLAWGVFYLAFHGAMLCLLSLVRRQWYENERLTFPLAQIQLALVETPRQGERLAGIFRARGFWILFFAILLLHTWNALYQYQVKLFPEIPVKYDLSRVFSELPWSYLPGHVKVATIYFTAVGVSYLVPGAVSFSLWFFVVAAGLFQVQLGQFTGDPSLPGLRDQQYGGSIAYALIVLWIGRQHWAVILRQAFRGEAPGEPRGRYLSYRFSFWTLLACVAVMVGFLVAAGVSLGAAALAIVLLLLALMVVTRIVAETGLIQPGEILPLVRPWQVAAYYGMASPVSNQTFWLTSNLSFIHHDNRETFGVFASHAMKVTDETVFSGRRLEQQQAPDRSTGRKLVGVFLLVIVVSYVTSFSSMVFVEYAWAMEKHTQAPEAVNRYIPMHAVSGHLTTPTVSYDTGSYNYAHDPATHLVGGAVATTALSVLRLNYAWWPLHPIGYLCLGTWPMQQLWYSIFLGWLLRTVTLKFGGASLYTTLRAAMIGMILGEAVASALWLALAFSFSLAGIDYRPLRFTLH